MNQSFIATQNHPQNFVQQLQISLQEMQLQKTLQSHEKQNNYSFFKQQKNAKETLIQIDQQHQNSRMTEQEISIGRWSAYRVKQNPQSRLSLPKTIQKNIETRPNSGRYKLMKQKSINYYGCKSQKTIPKLKIMLHQLQCNLEVPPPKQISRNTSARQTTQSVKLLQTYNKQQPIFNLKAEIQKHSPFQKKGGENTRPTSTIKKQRTPSSSYHKIKRHFGSLQQKQLIQQKQILTQLLKGVMLKSNNQQPLTNMMNYFHLSNDKHKTTKNLTKLLS